MPWLACNGTALAPRMTAISNTIVLAPAASVSSRTPPGSRSERLVFIDALRGIAALAVAAYHIERYGPLAEPASRILQGPVETIIEHGWMGVQVFFVIS